MLTREKQKAIIEGLLFVSPQPVTLQQIMRKIRTILRRERDALAKAEGEAAPASEEQTVPEVVAEASVQSDPSDLSDAPEGSDESDAAMDQLLQKQKELDDDVNREEIKSILKDIQDGLAADDHGIELVQVAKGYQYRTKYEISCYLKEEQPDSPTRLSPSSLETLAIVAYQQPVTKNKIEEVRGVDSGGVLKTLLDKEFIRIVGRSDEPGKPLIYGTSQRFLEIFGLSSLKDLPSLQDFQEMALAEAQPETTRSAGEESDSILPPEDPSILDENEMADISEAEQAILEELDQSLKNLKDVEKKMAPPKEPQQQTGPTAES